ncbi:MAG: MaoC family dehydratase [Hyphomonadaceae bacterium]|nr:MaoC family dehydratase [Hyphomonadaceae bacterium]
MSQPQGYAYEDLEIGMFHETHHTITEDDIQAFADVSGDHNPLHMDEDFAKTTIFGQRIAHGALTASYISGILGNNLPGPGAIFTHLSMRFRRPVYIGSDVTVRAEVIEKQDKGNRVTLKVSCIVEGKPVITGEAGVVAPSKKA